MSEHILVRRDGPIATVVLNRPDKLNAMTKPMWLRLGEVIEVLSDDDDLRCLGLSNIGLILFVSANICCKKSIS